MTFGVEKERPPYIEFEERAVEDRDASIEAGHLIHKNVDFVISRQIGSVNTVEKIAEEWLQDQQNLADRGRIPQKWAEFFKQRYADYKEGKDPTVDGTALRLWPAISKADVENCARLKIFSVEDLAQINDETMQKLGMGSRALQQKAKAYLDARGDTATEELAALRAKAEDQAQTIETLLQKVEELEADRKGGTKKKAGRKAA